MAFHYPHISIQSLHSGAIQKLFLLRDAGQFLRQALPCRLVSLEVPPEVRSLRTPRASRPLGAGLPFSMC
jgi:hypothetical protein